ncbi:NAD(P)-binding protein, partial [Wolfiporia cocos MD-104 SS10]
MSLLVLSKSDVAAVTSRFNPDELTDLMASVFALLSEGNGPSPLREIHQPHRTSLPMLNHTALFMPSRIDSVGTAVKVVSVPSSSASQETKERGLPASTLVLNESSGNVKAIVNARQLTALRNAAGSLLATRLLVAPSKPPFSLLAVGAGAQIAAHVDLFLRHFRTLTSCTIYNRSLNSRLASLLSTLAQRHPDIKLTADALPSHDSPPTRTYEEVVRNADIIITATSSTEPLFPSAFVKSGCHLCLIGSYKPEMHEIDSELIRRARVVVDSKEASMAEAGEIIDARLNPSDLTE